MGILLSFIMLLLRKISLNAIYSQVLQKIPVNDDQIHQVMKVSKNLNEYQLRNLTFVLTNWYKARCGRDGQISTLESHIEPALPTMTTKTFDSILKSLILLYKSGYKKFSRQFLTKILSKFSEHSDIDQKILLGSDLSKLALLYKSSKIKILEDFSVLINTDLFHSSTLPQFFHLLQIFNNFYNCEFFVDLEIEEFLEACEVRIQKDLPKMSIKEKFECLQHLIVCSSKSEDLLKKIEVDVFGSLSQIPIGDFSNFYKYYKKRNLHDYHYLINNVHKPLFEDFMKRSQQMHPKALTSYLTTWKQVSSFQGLYCEKSIMDKLQVLIETQKQSGNDRAVFDQTLHSILSLSNFTGFSESKKIADNVVKVFENSVKDIYEPTLVALAYQFSLHPGISLTFWNSFNQVFEKVHKKIEKKGYLYGIYLNLYLQDLEAYKVVKGNFDLHLDGIRESWKNFREDDLKISEKSSFHSKVENELKKMNLDPVCEYYDNYFIDLALVKEKIAIEILGPGHYVYPYGILNGKTQNRKRNLELLGWKYVEIPFNYNKTGLSAVKKTILSKIPLDS